MTRRIVNPAVQGETVFVSSVSDFPAPVAGVITLEDNRTYFLTGNIDLLGARLVGGQNSVIIGGSSENCILSSTGLAAGTPLFSSAWSCPVRFMAFSHGTALALDASGNANQAIDWFGVNFLNCATIGTMANYGNVVLTSAAWLNSEGMTIDGSIGTVSMDKCLVQSVSGTGLTVAATATISRRFRIFKSSVVAGALGTTGLDVSTSASIPVESYQLDDVNFAGSGTYTAGVQYDDNKSLWINCKGVENSASTGLMTFTGNTTATTISVQGVAVKAAGATTFQTTVSQRFSHSDNRLTYTGAITRRFRVAITASMLATNNTQVGSYIAKNGAVISFSEIYTTADGNNRSENVAVQTIVELTQNDYVEFWVENESGTNDITIEDMTVIVNEI
jgi:hypothetical protein